MSDWNKNYERFNAFVETNGRLPRHRAQDISERRLERWQSDQRRRYFGTLTKQLSDEQRRLVEASPRLLERAADARWDQRLREVNEFVANTGRVPSATSHDPAERSLASWRNAQNAKAGNGNRGGRAELSAEQLEKLRATSWFRPSERVTKQAVSHSER